MGYTTVEILRDEGILESDIGDDALQARIDYVSSLIDQFTGRFFEPRAKTVRLDGSGARVQPVYDPIISVTSVTILTGHPDSPVIAEPVPADAVVVYNRHLTQGLTNPDDRDNPRIEIEDVSDVFLIGPVVNFPRARQNVVIDGVFGYTDPTAAVATSTTEEPFALADGMTLSVTVDGGDPQVVAFSAGDFTDVTAATAAEVADVLRAGLTGVTVTVAAVDRVRISTRTRGASSQLQFSGTARLPLGLPLTAGEAEGVTPPLIVRAATLMVIRDADPLSSDAHDESTSANRVTSMRTRDQSVSFGLSGAGGSNNHQFIGSFTGDPEIDNLLAMFVRPDDLGFLGGRNDLEQHGSGRYWDDPYYIRL